MKYYSKKIITDFIEAYKQEIQSVDVGMDEDWFWTAETVWNVEVGYYNCMITDNDNITIAGIGGSRWATPVMRVYYNDDSIRIIPCYI